jgi:hypothetical protein
LVAILAGSWSHRGICKTRRFEKARLVAKLRGARERQRLTHLVLIGPEDVPEELRPAFSELVAALTSEEPKGTEGRLVATLKVMDEQQAQNIARAIVDLYQSLGRLLHERR